MMLYFNLYFLINNSNLITSIYMNNKKSSLLIDNSTKYQINSKWENTEKIMIRLKVRIQGIID